MPHSPSLKVTFYGVRGSIACPGEATLRYGGNTSCIKVECGEHLLIFDAGTGLKRLGDELATESLRSVHLLFSHTHLDHISGFPFFRPAYMAGFDLHLWAGHLRPNSHLREQIDHLMASPLFPIGINVMGSHPNFHDFQAGGRLDIGIPDVTVTTTAIPHPNGATAYRIEHAGKSVCYVTDTEHTPGRLNADIVALVKDADLFIYDSTYTDEEYPHYQGWGHSTWQEGTRLAEAAGVKTYIAFHHDPSHDDAFMDDVARQLQAMRPGSIVAKEGMAIEL